MPQTWPAKDPDEVLDYRWDIELVTGDAVATAVVTVISGSVVIQTQAADAEGATIWLAGGTAGGVNTLRGLATTTGGRTIEETFYLPVVASDAVLTAYVTPEEYHQRFQITETIGLTNPNADAPDQTILNAALQAGTDMVDSYAGARYALPLSPVPSVVKDAVADLARERLFTLYPNEEVTKRADRVRAWLKDLSAGKVELVGVGGALVDEGTADQPAVYAPDAVFSDCVLSSYRGRLQ